MFRLRYWRSLLADDSRRYAVVGGLLALPFAARSYWRTGTTLELESVFVAGLLVGYFFRGTADEVARVGSRTGFVGALPVLLWMVFDLVAYAFSEPSLSSVPLVAIGAAVAVVAVGGLFAGLVGAIGARIGNWVRGKIGSDRSAAVPQ